MASVKPELIDLASATLALLELLADKNVPNAAALREAVESSSVEDEAYILRVAAYLLRESRNSIAVMHRDVNTAITIGQNAFAHYQSVQAAPAHEGNRAKGNKTRRRIEKLMDAYPDITAEKAVRLLDDRGGDPISVRTAQRHLAALRKARR